MDKPTQPSSSNNSQDKKPNDWLVYSGMAFEMFAIIGIFTTAGFFLDKKIDTKPVLLIVFMMIGLGIAFYRIYKQIS